MTGPGKINIQVADFGPIVKANVDLRPFTLFVGPSNTGKSYLAIMIYALHQLFGGSSMRFPPIRGGPLRWYPHHQWRSGPTDEALLSAEDVNDLIDWAKQEFSEIRIAKEIKGASHLPEKIAALIRPLLESARVPDKFAGDEIARCFGLDSPAQLVRRQSSTGGQIVLRRYIETEKGGEKPFVHKLDISKRGSVKLSVSIPTDNPLWVEKKRIEHWIPEVAFIENDDDQEERKSIALRSISYIAGAVFPYIIGSIGSPAFYLPADRTGVMHAHRVVVSALVERAASAGIHPASPMPMLSGVLADFLRQLIALGDRRGWRRRGWKRRGREALATKLERTILKGDVRHEESAESESYPLFSYRPTGWKDSLPLMHASSMVSELAPVVLYLRHFVRPGDVLIIEEPESHLHPAMQVEFTRLLAAAVREGIRIIMTTHSEWVLDELANLVKISELKKADRKGIPGGDTPLAAHEVGAWLFQPKNRPKGSIVQEIKLDPDSGIFPSGYEEVAAALHNRWAEISSYSE